MKVFFQSLKINANLFHRNCKDLVSFLKEVMSLKEPISSMIESCSCETFHNGINKSSFVGGICYPTGIDVTLGADLNFKGTVIHVMQSLFDCHSFYNTAQVLPCNVLIQTPRIQQEHSTRPDHNIELSK